MRCFETQKIKQPWYKLCEECSYCKTIIKLLFYREGWVSAVRFCHIYFTVIILYILAHLNFYILPKLYLKKKKIRSIHSYVVCLISFICSRRLHRTKGPTLGRRSCWESVNVSEHLVSPPMTTMPRRACSSSRPATASSTVRTEATTASSWVHCCFFAQILRTVFNWELCKKSAGANSTVQLCLLWLVR